MNCDRQSKRRSVRRADFCKQIIRSGSAGNRKGEAREDDKKRGPTSKGGGLLRRPLLANVWTQALIPADLGIYSLSLSLTLVSLPNYERIISSTCGVSYDRHISSTTGTRREVVSRTHRQKYHLIFVRKTKGEGRREEDSSEEGELQCYPHAPVPTCSHPVLTCRMPRSSSDVVGRVLPRCQCRSPMGPSLFRARLLPDDEAKVDAKVER